MQALGAGEVEIRFVDGSHFDDGRELAEDCGNAIAPFRIFFVMTIEEDGVRTEFPGGAERHRGLDTVFAGFVAGGGNYAALIGTAAYYYWFATEVGAIEKFYGDEEGVHIHVEDGGVEREVALIEGVVFGTEARESGMGEGYGFGSGGGRQKFCVGRIGLCLAEFF